MITLYDYQDELIALLRNSMNRGNKHIIMQLGTGGGKTITFSYMVKKAVEKGIYCLIITDRVKLLEQAGGTFDKVGITDYDIITRETKVMPSSRVVIAMAETLKRRLAGRLDAQMMMQKFGLVIIDEAHKGTFNKIFSYISTKAYVIGATATPISANKKEPLSKYYDDLVQGVSIEEMIKRCKLSKPWYGCKKLADFSGLKIKGSDFDDKQLEDIYTDVKLFAGLEEWKKNDYKDRKTVIFCSNVKVSKEVAQLLGCLHIDGYMSQLEQEHILYQFENTDGAIISNVDMLTTGYDCPEITNVVLYRDTLSLPLFLQMCGRGSRITDTKKRFYIYDFGRNIQRFGYWHIDRTWSLEPPSKKKKTDKDGMFAMKECPKCGYYIHAALKECPDCGYVYPISEKEKLKIEFELLSYDEIVAKARSTDNVEKIEALREAKGYKKNWTLRQFTSAYQFQEYARLKGYKSGWSKRMIDYYLHK